MNITDENFEKELNNTNKLVLVDFFATWCEPCSILGPILEKMAEKFKDDIILLKANLDDTPLAAKKFNVEKIPTIILFKNGKSVSGFVGLLPEQTIKGWLENAIKENK